MAFAVLVAPGLEDTSDASKDLLCQLLATLGPSPVSARICRIEHATSPAWVAYAPLARWDLHEELCSEEGVSNEVEKCYLLLSCQRRMLHGHPVVEVTIRTPNVQLLPTIRVCLLSRFHKLHWVVAPSRDLPFKDQTSFTASASTSSSFLLSSASSLGDTWGSIAASLQSSKEGQSMQRALENVEVQQVTLGRVPGMGWEEGESETKRIITDLRQLYGTLRL
jgi:hypothetical protein